MVNSFLAFPNLKPENLRLDYKKTFLFIYVKDDTVTTQRVLIDKRTTTFGKETCRIYLNFEFVSRVFGSGPLSPTLKFLPNNLLRSQRRNF